MPLSNIRSLLAATTLAAAFAVAQSQIGLGAEAPETPAAEKTQDGGEKEPLAPLSATEFYTMAPFVVPLFTDGKHSKQLVMVVAIGLNDEDDRDEIRRLSPKLRNEIYQLMFKIVSFRTIKPRMPAKKVLQAKLIVAARRIVGDEIVKSFVVHNAYVTDVN